MGHQQHLELLDGLLTDALHRQPHAYRPGLLQLRDLQDLDLVADQLGKVVPSIDPRLDQHDPVVLQLVAVFGHRLREDHDLHHSTQVLQVEDGHQVPASGPLLGEVRDHPADHPDQPVIDLGQVVDAGFGSASQRPLVAAQRVV